MGRVIEILRWNLLGRILVTTSTLPRLPFLYIQRSPSAFLSPKDIKLHKTARTVSSSSSSSKPSFVKVFNYIYISLFYDALHFPIIHCFPNLRNAYCCVPHHTISEHRNPRLRRQWRSYIASFAVSQGIAFYRTPPTYSRDLTFFLIFIVFIY